MAANAKADAAERTITALQADVSRLRAFLADASPANARLYAAEQFRVLALEATITAQDEEITRLMDALDRQVTSK